VAFASTSPLLLPTLVMRTLRWRSRWNCRSASSLSLSSASQVLSWTTVDCLVQSTHYLFSASSSYVTECCTLIPIKVEPSQYHILATALRPHGFQRCGPGACRSFEEQPARVSRLASSTATCRLAGISALICSTAGSYPLRRCSRHRDEFCFALPADISVDLILDQTY
jgi:hypothetical protein